MKFFKKEFIPVCRFFNYIMLLENICSLIKEILLEMHFYRYYHRLIRENNIYFGKYPAANEIDQIVNQKFVSIIFPAINSAFTAFIYGSFVLNSDLINNEWWLPINFIPQTAQLQFSCNIFVLSIIHLTLFLSNSQYLKDYSFLSIFEINESLAKKKFQINQNQWNKLQKIDRFLAKSKLLSYVNLVGFSILAIGMEIYDKRLWNKNLIYLTYWYLATFIWIHVIAYGELAIFLYSLIN